MGAEICPVGFAGCRDYESVVLLEKGEKVMERSRESCPGGKSIVCGTFLQQGHWHGSKSSGPK